MAKAAIRTNVVEMAQGNEVSNCKIHGGGKLYQSAIGVWIGQSPNNRIMHNAIYDFYYTGISIGCPVGHGAENGRHDQCVPAPAARGPDHNQRGRPK